MITSKFLRSTVCILIIILASANTFSQVKLNTPDTDSQLYLGKGKKQPLIVGLGGSEGGNAWTSDHWKNTRDQFLEKGYAFLALGYFGAEGTPQQLEKIALEDVHNAIVEAVKNPLIDKSRIAIVGGSRGGDLALLLASYFSDIKCVVAIVPSHVSFPGNTNHLSTSSWTFNGKELPFVPVNDEAVPFLMEHKLRETFEAMLKDTAAEEKALIPVEKINAPILFLSATRDEIAPTQPMCDKMEARLKASKFKYHHEHIAIEGSHAEPLKHFDLVFKFLAENFK